MTIRRKLCLVVYFVMLDFFKIDPYYGENATIEHLDFLENKFVHEFTVQSDTGEKKYPIKIFYNTLTIRIFRNEDTRKLTVYGSIHSFYNSIKSDGYSTGNYSDFTYNEFCEAATILQQELRLDLRMSSIQNLEFNITCEIDQDVNTVLNQHLLGWNYQDHTSNTTINYKSEYRQFKIGNKIIKIYDKGNSNNRGKKRLRFEVKNTKNIGLPKPLKTFDQLLLRDTWNILFSNLLTEFDKLNILDTFIPLPAFDEKQRDLFLTCSNIQTWTQYNKAKSHTDSERKAHQRRKKAFKKLLKDYSLLTIKHSIRDKICHKFTTLFDGANVTKTPISIVYNCDNLQDNEAKRYCKQTGLDITHQKKGSEFFTKTSIRKAHQDNRELFNEIERTYKPVKTCYSEIEYFNAIAKKIRDTYRNREESKRRKAEKYNGMKSLFD